MNTSTVDNSIFADLSRVITWQYDNASNLISLIMMMKKFYDSSTNVFWTNWRLNVIDIDNADDYGLAIWGKLLSCPRPEIKAVPSAGIEQQTLPKELYRKLLKGRFRLLNGNASMNDYCDYVDTVFGGKVTVASGGSMDMTFTATQQLSEIEKAFINQYPDIAFIYPAGVKDNVDADGLFFGFAKDGDSFTPCRSDVGGLNEATFKWR